MIKILICLSLLLVGCATFNPPMPRSCVVDSACFQAKQQLKSCGLESKLLFIRYMDGPSMKEHCYCLYQTVSGTWFLYDPNCGSYPVLAPVEDPLDVAKQVVLLDTIVVAYYK